MPRRSGDSRRLKSPRAPFSRFLTAFTLAIIATIVLAFVRRASRDPAEIERPAVPPGESTPNRHSIPRTLLFCTWNVENFYDDRDDPAINDLDENLFAADPDLVARKIDLLSATLAAQNDGRGPDVVVLVEVESRRCLQLLAAALNRRIRQTDPYHYICFREHHLDRGLAPAIISRFQLETDSRLQDSFGERRIVAARIVADDRPLTILACHWTSRITDKTGKKREAYADVIYRSVTKLIDNDPAADILIAGDFNDEPRNPSVRVHLHASGDRERVVAGDPRPTLYDLSYRINNRVIGTYHYGGRWETLDHIVVSPGMLDRDGWSVDTESFEVIAPAANRKGRAGTPKRFGSPRDTHPRGPSDHFPLSVRLIHNQ
jgi:endonuclease/exonuclease/phosphatase family metal-dependent hydrolase